MKTRTGTKHDEIAEQESIRTEESSERESSDGGEEEEVTVSVGLKDGGGRLCTRSGKG